MTATKHGNLESLAGIEISALELLLILNVVVFYKTVNYIVNLRPRLVGTPSPHLLFVVSLTCIAC